MIAHWRPWRHSNRRLMPKGAAKHTDCAAHTRPGRTWTILRHDGPSHLGLWCNALRLHQNGPNHLGSACVLRCHRAARQHPRAGDASGRGDEIPPGWEPVHDSSSPLKHSPLKLPLKQLRWPRPQIFFFFFFFFFLEVRS